MTTLFDPVRINASTSEGSAVYLPVYLPLPPFLTENTLLVHSWRLLQELNKPVGHIR